MLVDACRGGLPQAVYVTLMYITGGPANFAIPVLAVARSLWRAY